MIILLSILSSIFVPLRESILVEFEGLGKLQEAVGYWIDGDKNSLNDLLSLLNSFLSEKRIVVMQTIIKIIGFYAMTIFFFFMTDIPIVKVLYNKMQQGYSEKFHLSLISSLPQSLLYSFLMTVIVTVVDVLIIMAVIALLIALYPVIGFFAISIVASLALFLLAGRVTLISQYVPLIVCEEKNLIVALKESITKSVKSFSLAYIPLLITIIVFFAIFMSTIVSTFAIVPVLIIPTYLVMKNCIRLVVYSAEKKKPYYTTDAQTNEFEIDVSDDVVKS
jgi:hypothetical protein